MDMSGKARNYDAVAGTYEFLSHVYSTGQIKAAKFAQFDWINDRSDLCYLGCGSGEDVIEAASRGHNVTAVDISAKMLNRLRRKLSRRNLNAKLILCDIFEYTPETRYDAVCANFFFNVFNQEQLESVIDKAISLAKPGGQLMISDVALPRGWLPSRMFNWCYINGAQLLAALGGLVSLHHNHDYHNLLAKRNLAINSTRHFRMFKFGPVLFQSLNVGLESPQSGENLSKA
jgi:ubiquinone/menaquinone biosynthesis C-methylase UbiE